MFTTISDYPSVTDRATDIGLRHPSGIAILPINFDSAQDQEQLLQRSEAATVRSLLRQAKMPPDELLPRPKTLGFIQNNSFEWVGPIIFFSASLFSNSPDVFAVVINVLSNYLTDFFKGVSGTKNVKLKVVIETTPGGTCKMVSFDGPLEALGDIRNVIKEINRES